MTVIDPCYRRGCDALCRETYCSEHDAFEDRRGSDCSSEVDGFIISFINWLLKTF